MTMINPAENLYKLQHPYGGYGGRSYSNCFGVMNQLEGYDCGSSEACLGESDLVVGRMAEDESKSRTESVNEAGSSSKDVQEEKDEGWLQLSIGGHMASHDHDNKVDQRVVDLTSRRGGLLELDLLPAGGSSHSQQVISPLAPPMFHAPDQFRAPRPVTNFTSATGYNTSLLFQHPGTSSSTFSHQEISWAFRPFPRNIAAASSSSSSPSLMAPGPYFARPFQIQTGIDIAGPSIDFRVVDPPRRPHSGIWFMLQASQNQVKEPFLPQISKSYLRIKDGRMTIRLLMKYLVNKLRLDSESEGLSEENA
ncbi:unnamed protein product [Ilex paraguariensis]|uniref:RING finger protein n=1 Tax=Ilex paraguariensis TaxID=185542 RepID=A0ABC8RHE1_9AQUA